jgi:hypothetical protein
VTILPFLSGISTTSHAKKKKLMTGLKVSLDPHISHKIILLLADLARLCPELTCQSMMPIFTFVGAHVIQRDDAFSARVVDKVRTDRYYIFVSFSVTLINSS